jgi:predicted dehydrogenase
MLRALYTRMELATGSGGFFLPLLLYLCFCSAIMERLSIAVVGLSSGESAVQDLFGGVGERFCRVTAVCDSNTEKVRRICKKCDAAPYNDLGALLTDSEVQAVALFTSPVGRATSVEKIVRAGKDVITSNPIDLDPNRTIGVLEEARNSGRVVHLNSPCTPVTADMEQIAFWRRRFDLGEPLNARSENWAPPDKTIRGKWYENPRRCPIIPILRLGVSAINDLVQVFGPGEAVQLVQARQFTKFAPPDHACATIRFRGGGIASVSTSLGMGFPEVHGARLVVNYQNGSIIRKVPSEKDGKVELALRRPGHEGGLLTKFSYFSPAECSGHPQWEAFHRATQGRTTASEIVSEQIVDGVKILSALAKSQASGRIEML